MPRSVNRKSDEEPAEQIAISQAPDYEEIALRAYERFTMRGAAHGRDQEDWFEAEREVRARDVQQKN